MQKSVANINGRVMLANIEYEEEEQEQEMHKAIYSILVIRHDEIRNRVNGQYRIHHY